MIMTPMFGKLGQSLPIIAHFVFPPDQHFARNPLEHKLIPLAEQALPVTSLAFGEKGGDILVAAG